MQKICMNAPNSVGDGPKRSHWSPLKSWTSSRLEVPIFASDNPWELAALADQSERCGGSGGSRKHITRTKCFCVPEVTVSSSVVGLLSLLLRMTEKQPLCGSDSRSCMRWRRRRMTSSRGGWLCAKQLATRSRCIDPDLDRDRPRGRLHAGREDLDDDHPATAARAGAGQDSRLIRGCGLLLFGLNDARRAGQHRAARVRVRCWRHDGRWRTSHNGGYGGSLWAARERGIAG